MMDYKLWQAEAPHALLVLAHGAGAGSDSEFIQSLAGALVDESISVVTFDFPYMQQALATGKKRPPDRMPKLEAHYLGLLAQIGICLPVFIGGKSMGGRVASLILEQSQALGAVVYGYPFHPPGKPEKLRTEHLLTLNKPMLIIQGERDTFGNQQQASGYSLSNCIQTQFLIDGDHSFKPRKSSGLTQAQHIKTAAKLTSQFIQQQL